MTDKQIIIDGCDVSGCCYYSEGKCLGCYALDEKDCISCYGKCKEINDCYYKNWKRKEQECEKYKDKFNHIKKSLERIVKSHDVDFDNGLLREMKRIIKECEVLEQ